MSVKLYESHHTNCKVSLFGCLFVNYAETSQQILIKFGIETGYELTWEIEYDFFSQGSASEAAGRIYI